MSSYWPTEDGWPYPDSLAEPEDLDFDLDEDRLAVRERSTHLFDGLEPLERAVVTGRFGLDGRPARSMKELHTELGLTRQVLGETLGSGLAKLRRQLIV
jgi:DNA-directed RNA polymerase sigma subunit (sigma70/sigma32)